MGGRGRMGGLRGMGIRLDGVKGKEKENGMAGSKSCDRKGVHWVGRLLFGIWKELYVHTF